MNARRRFGHRLGIVALAVVGLAVISTPAWAQDQESAGDDLKTREVFSMSEDVYQELAKAQDKINEQQHAEALRILGKLKDDEDLSSYERSQVWNLYAFIYHSQDMYPEAINALKKVLAEQDVDEAVRTSTIYSLAVLNYSLGEWRQVIDYVKRWMSLTKDPTAQGYELLAEAHYQLEEYREVVPHMRKAMELKRAAGQKVTERPYLLIRAAYAELKQHDEAAAVLEELIRLFPSDNYWMQLAATYGEAGEEKKQLNVMQLIYLQGYLDTEQELLSLAGLLLRNDLPYRAGKVLEKGLEDGVLESNLDNWKLLSQAWTLAQEDRKAIPALTRGAQLSDDGELDIVLAQMYANIEDWQAASKAVRTGIRKGGLRRTDQAYFLLGQVMFNLDAFDDARTAFERAQTDNRSRRLATKWLSYIDSELDRRAKLREATSG